MSRPVKLQTGRDRPFEPRCEVCGAHASFGYRAPGIAALRQPCRWYCAKHRHVGEQGRAG